MKRLFANRYGIDRLSIFLAIFSLGFIFSRYMWILGLIILAYVLYRAISKNFVKRQSELHKFEILMYRISMFLYKAINPFVNKIKKLKKNSKQRKFYKYIKCRYCEKKLRLPKDKGKIKVTCPECKNQFIVKT